MDFICALALHKCERYDVKVISGFDDISEDLEILGIFVEPKYGDSLVHRI